MSDTREYLLSKLPDYLKDKGIDTRRNFKCLSGTHEDKNPSMSYDPKGNYIKCFSCNASYNLIDLIAHDYNLSDAEAFKKALELYNVDQGYTSRINKNKEIDRELWPDEAKKARAQGEEKKPETEEEKKLEKLKEQNRKYILECKARAEETDYFKIRGLSSETIERFNLGYDPHFTQSTKGKVWQAIIIPTSDYTYTARNTNREAPGNERVRKTTNIEQPIYNLEALYNGLPTFIVEGEIDALSFFEIGSQAVSLGGTQGQNKLIRELEKNPPTSPIVLSLDKDEPGRNASDKLKDKLREIGIEAIEIDVIGEFNDPNEALTEDREGFKKRIAEASPEEIKRIAEAKKEEEKQEYLKKSARYKIDDFINNIETDTPYIPTGFPALDKVLEGGLFEGLYIIGAISSLGKTTYILQIADQIAQQGKDVLIFSLEMATYELMAKSISRLTFNLCEITNDAKTTRGITTHSRYDLYTDKEIDLINKSIEEYSSYAGNLYIAEGVGNIGAQEIKETVQEHIRITGNAPVVVIDYLQILSPYDIRATDKQNTDKAVLELKRLSRDYKIPVIGISSFNRANYKKDVSMEAFKESGAIEYSSDVLLGMQFKRQEGEDKDEEKGKKKDPREIEVKILKNRNGKTEVTLEYEYYPKFNYFEEVRR